jgi:hypothetical protein
MDIRTAINEFGSEGVRHYREISSIVADNEVPEAFLSGFIASRLHDRFGCPVHVERSYMTIAKDIGVEPSPELEAEIGGYRADVAMYQEGLPPAIIELKIFDEGCQLSSIRDDLDKMDRLARRGKLRGYVGLLICETSSKNLKARKDDLEDALRREILLSRSQKSTDGKWSWCFGCAQF